MINMIEDSMNASLRTNKKIADSINASLRTNKINGG